MLECHLVCVLHSVFLSRTCISVWWCVFEQEFTGMLQRHGCERVLFNEMLRVKLGVSQQQVHKVRVKRVCFDMNFSVCQNSVSTSVF